MFVVTRKDLLIGLMGRIQNLPEHIGDAIPHGAIEPIVNIIIEKHGNALNDCIALTNEDAYRGLLDELEKMMVSTGQSPEYQEVLEVFNRHKNEQVWSEDRANLMMNIAMCRGMLELGEHCASGERPKISPAILDSFIEASIQSGEAAKTLEELNVIATIVVEKSAKYR